MKDNKEFWNFTAKFIYDFGHCLEKKSYINVATNINQKLKNGDKVLELSCGTGILTKEIIKRNNMNIDYKATDFSKEMLKKCKQKIPNLDIEIADATNLQFEDASFDKIIMANALHIMPNPKLALKEIRRVLKDDGIFFAPNFLTPSTVNESIIMSFPKLIGYKVFNGFELEEFIIFLEENGFKVNKKEIYTQCRSLLYTENQKILKKQSLKK